MLDRSDMQKQAASWAGIAIIVAGITLIALMISVAAKVEGNELVTVSVGPLSLIELGRQQIDGQTAAVFRYLPGLIYYFFSALFLGAFFGFAKSKLTNL